MKVKIKDEHGNERYVDIFDPKGSFQVSAYVVQCEGCGDSLLVGEPHCKKKKVPVSGFFNVYKRGVGMEPGADYHIYGPKPSAVVAIDQASEQAAAVAVFMSFEVDDK
jgi:hypothetical protein